MTTQEVCRDYLDGQIKSMEALIRSAEECLDDGDFLQCAVRMEEASSKARFDNLLMAVFDSMSHDHP
ncbi:hypothetical protein [Porticoccus sp.]